jgi:hypothetical protein
MGGLLAAGAVLKAKSPQPIYEGVFCQHLGHRNYGKRARCQAR